MIIIVIQLVIILILLMFSFSFSGSETSYTSIDKFTLARLVREKKISDKDKKYFKKSHSLIPAILVGNNIVNIASTAILTALSINISRQLPFLSESLAILISTSLFTVALLLFGEILPKTFALIYKEGFLLKFFGFMKFFYALFKPITKVLSILTSFVLNKFTPDGVSNKDFMFSSVDDITNVIHIGHKEGFIEEETRDYLTGIIEFPSKTVSDIMIPRVNIECLNADTKIPEILMISNDTGHTRYPVYEDTIDNIIGILNVKNIIKDYINGKHEKKAIDYTMTPYFVPEDKMLGPLLQDMKHHKLKMAVIVDEYGGTSGIVSVEDILEEIVGEIEDDTDKDKKNIARKDNKIIVKGEATLEEVNDALRLRLTHKDFQTIAGYALHVLGRIPHVNEKFTISSYNVVVKKIEDRRIVELEFKRAKNGKNGSQKTTKNSKHVVKDTKDSKEHKESIESGEQEELHEQSN